MKQFTVTFGPHGLGAMEGVSIKLWRALALSWGGSSILVTMHYLDSHSFHLYVIDVRNEIKGFEPMT